MIEFTNGHRFQFMAASGAGAFDGRGWPWEQPLRWLGLFNLSLMTVVIKTLTLTPRPGNLRWWKPWDCVRLVEGGTVNAVGLTNPGAEWWCREIGPSVRFGQNLVVSILGDPDELTDMVKMVNPFEFVGLELNASCPNTHADVLTNTGKVIEGCRRVCGVSRFPVILKLSYAHKDEMARIIGETERWVESYSINSVPWKDVFGDRPSPLAHHKGGGVSGRAAQPFTWKTAAQITSLTKRPVIWPGVWSYCDLEQLLDPAGLNAPAVSFGSVFIPKPWAPTTWIRRYKREHV